MAVSMTICILCPSYGTLSLSRLRVSLPARSLLSSSFPDHACVRAYARLYDASDAS